MGERYLISGVQWTLLNMAFEANAPKEHTNTWDAAKSILEEIHNTQFIGDSAMDLRIDVVRYADAIRRKTTP